MYEHPFWVPELGQWVEAKSLRSGMHLRTPDGTSVPITSNRPFGRRARTYNLTVDDLHTYYVLAGDAPVLVHNSNSFLTPLGAQVQKVINYFDKTGRTPAGVMKGGKKGYQRGEFTNDAGKLPKRKAGYYTESDVWPTGGVNRGVQRLVFGERGEVYYSGDHYKTFYRVR
ncbi:ribonuclease domain-containing protein [Streptomyces sp. NPDC005017]|uniref:ribonuclease domain-containing protein n=1 Tax=Streptomyces sp. NPDC005017 TaxID=3364706 RepID=UPI0036A7A966